MPILSRQWASVSRVGDPHRHITTKNARRSFRPGYTLLVLSRLFNGFRHLYRNEVSPPFVSPGFFMVTHPNFHCQALTRKNVQIACLTMKILVWEYCFQPGEINST